MANFTPPPKGGPPKGAPAGTLGELLDDATDQFFEDPTLSSTRPGPLPAEEAPPVQARSPRGGAIPEPGYRRLSLHHPAAANLTPPPAYPQRTGSSPSSELPLVPSPSPGSPRPPPSAGPAPASPPLSAPPVPGAGAATLPPPSSTSQTVRLLPSHATPVGRQVSSPSATMSPTPVPVATSTPDPLSDSPVRGELGLQDEPPLIVELMADGRLRAPVQSTRELLRDRLKKAEVLRTGPSIAILRTLDPVDGGAKKDRVVQDREVVAAGSIGQGSISLIDFIGFLAAGLQTGVLTAATADILRSVYFHNGEVVWASSNAPGDRLGEFLLQRGKITREQLQVVLRDGERRIGRACVERGFMAAHELHTMLAAQLSDIFDKLLATDQGAWWFARLSAEVLADSQIHLSTQGLLVDALRRLDELQIYRQKVRSSDVVVQRVARRDGSTPGGTTQDIISEIDENAREHAEQLLRALPGSASISELMRILGRGEFDITRAVYHLLRRGLVELVPERETSPIFRAPESVSKTEAHEIISIYSMAIREMFNEVARISKDAALQAAANAFLSDQTTAFAQFLGATSVGADGALEENTLIATLQALHPTSQELSDALSELLFFVLFQATEFLGRRRGDDLARRVKLILGLLANTGVTTAGVE